MPLLWPGLWHHLLPLSACGGEVPRQAWREHARVPEEAPAAAARGEVPAAPGAEAGPGSTAGQPITPSHSRNIWPILTPF